jgi:Zn-dependent M16 (insulinase) family peptidase
MLYWKSSLFLSLFKVDSFYSEEKAIPVNISRVFTLTDIPYSVSVQSVSSNFATLSVLLDTTSLDVSLRPYLNLFSEMLFESNMKLDAGSILTSDDLVEALEDQLVSYFCNFGVEGNFKQGLVVSLKVPIDEVERALIGF